MQISPQQADGIIEMVGGTVKFAEMIGVNSRPWAQQRVSNWRVNGFPAQIILDNFYLLQRLLKQYEAQEKENGK